MDIAEFNKTVLKQFIESITDKVFLTIETDRELMQHYFNLIEEKGRNAINIEIAKAIKEKFDFESIDECETPKSLLIESYSRLKEKE